MALTVSMVLGVHRGESVDESYRSLNGNKDREKPGLEHRGESGGKIKQNGTGNLGKRVGGKHALRIADSPIIQTSQSIDSGFIIKLHNISHKELRPGTNPCWMLLTVSLKVGMVA